MSSGKTLVSGGKAPEFNSRLPQMPSPQNTERGKHSSGLWFCISSVIQRVILYGRYVNSMMKSNFLALRLASGLSGQDTFFPFDSSERTLLSDLIMLAMA